MKAINYGIEYQRHYAAMTDAGRVVSSVKDDRNFRPWVILWHSGLHGVHLAERALPLLSDDVCDIDHIHVLDFRRELFLACIARPWLVSILITRLTLTMVVGRNLSGLLDYPTIPVCMRVWLVGGAVNGAWFIQDLVQLRWTIFASLKGFLSLLPRWLLKPALTAVSSVSLLPPLLRRLLFLLRRGFPFPSRTSEAPGSLLRLLFLASQLSSPAQN